MKKRARFLLLGLISYFIFLIVTFPAAWAYRLIQNQLDGIQLGDVGGTVWFGSARVLKTDNFHLQNVDWEIRFLPLLLGRLELKLDSADEELKFNAYAGRTLGGTFYIRELQGQVPVATLQAKTPYSVPALQGQLIFDDLEIALSNGEIVKGTGHLLWKEATVTVGSPLELGAFSLQLETEAREITGKLKDAGGPLRAEGVVKLTPDGTYQFRGRFTPRDGNSDLGRNLRMLGAPNSTGDYEINYNGHLSVPAL